MEFFFLCSLVLFTLFISVSIGYFLLNKSSSSKTSDHHVNLPLPPGQMGLPYIGESLEFISTGRKGYPEKFVNDRIAKYSSTVFKSSILTEPTIFLCGAAGNKFLFSNENKYVNSWWPPSIDKIFNAGSSTEKYTSVETLNSRKMVASILKPESLMRYVGVMDSIAQKHFEGCWEGKQQVTASPLVRNYTFSIASKVFLSMEDPQEVEKLSKPFNVLISGIFSIPINFPGTTFSKAIKATKIIREDIRAIIQQRKVDLAENKASPTQDILSRLILATDENGQQISEFHIADSVLGLLVGGHDTATSVISCVIKYLSDYPHVYEQVLKEQMEIAKSKNPGELLNLEDTRKMKYSWNVACEVMRLLPPGQGGFKQAIHDFTFNGFSVPKGWKLYWSASFTHMNPECYPEPEKFDPTRFDGSGPAPYTFVPFGGGPRMCPGKEFARLEIVVFMHHLVKRFSWEKLMSNEKIVMDPMPVPEKGLPIRLIPHSV